MQLNILSFICIDNLNLIFKFYNNRNEYIKCINIK